MHAYVHTSRSAVRLRWAAQLRRFSTVQPRNATPARVPIGQRQPGGSVTGRRAALNTCTESRDPRTPGRACLSGGARFEIREILLRARGGRCYIGAAFTRGPWLAAASRGRHASRPESDSRTLGSVRCDGADASAAGLSASGAAQVSRVGSGGGGRAEPQPPALAGARLRPEWGAVSRALSDCDLRGRRIDTRALMFSLQATGGASAQVHAHALLAIIAGRAHAHACMRACPRASGRVRVRTALLIGDRARS